MPLVQTRGAASAQGFGEFAQATTANYIEDVFSTFLYTGTGAALTITNNIDLSTKGGLVWIKSRSSGTDHALFDTVRGAANGFLSSNTTSAPYATPSSDLTSFGVSGFSITNTTGNVDVSTQTYASWTFRKQPKFFDIQTWSGNSTARTIAHNLGSVPGCIMVKRTDATLQDWNVYHQSIGNEYRLALNGASAAVNIGNACWNSTTPTSTVFSLGTNSGVNSTGGTYVAYIFAHDAGGFGLLGTDNVISCGSFTANGSGGCSVTLGYEPQWIIYKNTAFDGWRMGDVMRGWSQTQWRYLIPNDPTVEGNLDNTPSYLAPTSTGFNSPTPGLFTPGDTFIYIAIRRGQMKVPTDTNNIFALNLAPDTSSSPLTWNTYSTVDSVLTKRNLSSTNGNNIFVDRVRGNSPTLNTNATSADGNNANITDLTISNGYIQKLVSTGGSGNAVTYAFSRAAGFFDIVCYTGLNSYQDLSHNLGVIPEMVIIKNRTGAQAWTVGLRSVVGTGKYLVLNTTAAVVSDVNYFGGPWTSAYVQVDGNVAPINQSGSTYVMYLFATCPGVSKVGTYTGNGTTQTINCGFAAGSRFVLIKRTDSTGDWYVWDSARGIVAGNDPHLSLNDTAAEVTTDDSVDTNSTGFVVNQNSATNINVTSATYIFLAIA